ncbi:DUF5686 and carboxypeptidase regulatory-like domain-containing protein [Solitalea sp. MAHUQ-68]|uniref:DUF5686 and carboxypeptidase regulatory-like domain-containing protein n=1 Tax=Solitalea agri TaxID=2953739 RepID=A0A9X2JFT9_9SPHI|nr:DUF5686 and carboxypeptidase-like regulatory domain-containing protein [Solitalea agri]MCO4293786.1 DUF5686 and carboxypeptidase regulatory-like domain-containing protein [Solitalea agri]
MYYRRFPLTFCVLIFFFTLPLISNAQWVLKGKIIDERYGDPLPGASISLLKTKGKGTISGANGSFKIILPQYINDSLEVNFVGYKHKKVALPRETKDTLVISIVPDAVILTEYVVSSKREDPAYDIIREALKRKKYNNLEKLATFEYESYSRIESYLNSSDSSSLQNMRVFKEMRKKAMELNVMKDSLGHSLIPIVAAETFSSFYQRNSPQAIREDVVGKNIKGIGLEDVDGYGELLTGKLNNYNFYKNYIRILSKDFSSPLGDGCILNYKFKLKADSDLVEGVWCYRIDIKPHNLAAVAFTGTIWLSLDDYALVKAVLKTNKHTTINFIENLSIEQNLVKVNESWMPVRTFSKAEAVDPQHYLPRLHVSYLTLNSNFAVNKPHDDTFYEQSITDSIIPEIELQRRKFLVNTNKNNSTPVAVFTQIEAMRNLNAVKQNVKLATVIGTLHYTTGQFDIGPITRMVMWNNVEGVRPGFAMRTNQFFHNNWQFAGSVAYGVKDEQFKYFGEVVYRTKNKDNSTWGANFQYDILPLNLVGENNSEWVNGNAFMRELYSTTTRWGKIAERSPFYQQQYKLWYDLDLSQSFHHKISFINTNLEEANLYSSNLGNSLTYTELLLETGFLKTKKKIRMKNNRQINVGGMQFPRVTVWLAAGIKGLFKGQYNYQKVYTNITQKNVNVLGLGHSFFQVNAGYVFSKVPFPLLRTHQGNESLLLYNRGFNQMKYAEFVSDHYVALNWNHSFDSPICDRIPVMAQLSRYLGCRTSAYAGVVFGGLRAENQELLNQWQATNPMGLKALAFNKPYVEIGGSLDNIFKFLSVGYFERLSYNLAGESTGGIKLAAKVTL